MRTPCCLGLACGVLVGALAVGNPFLHRESRKQMSPAGTRAAAPGIPVPLAASPVAAVIQATDTAAARGPSLAEVVGTGLQPTIDATSDGPMAVDILGALLFPPAPMVEVPPLATPAAFVFGAQAASGSPVLATPAFAPRPAARRLDRDPPR